MAYNTYYVHQNLLLCLKMLTVFVIVTIISATIVVDAAEQDVGSPLRVAQCRATCLKKFSNGGEINELTCLQGQDCFLCWENCELLQSNYQVWGVMCDETEICFPGCQEACAFHTEISKRQQQQQPVIHTKGESVINVTDGFARWPRPSSVNAGIPLVYVVMRRSSAGPWRQIIQTIDLVTRVPKDSGKEDSTLRVLVVDSKGLVTIYSPYESNLSVVKKRKKTINTENKSKNSTNEKWQLVEVSLIYQQFLVISEIAWEPKAIRGIYLVTWEVDGGGLRGNLFTDTTSVALSLWPDTIYHIQVELVTNYSGGIHLKTEMLDVNTGKAVKVATDPNIDNLKFFDNKEKSELLTALLTARSEKNANTDASVMIVDFLVRLGLFALFIIITLFLLMGACFLLYCVIQKNCDWMDLFLDPEEFFKKCVKKQEGKMPKDEDRQPIVTEPLKSSMSDLYVNIMIPASLDKTYPDITTFKIPNIARTLNNENAKNFYYIHQPTTTPVPFSSASSVTTQTQSTNSNTMKFTNEFNNTFNLPTSAIIDGTMATNSTSTFRTPSTFTPTTHTITNGGNNNNNGRGILTPDLVEQTTTAIAANNYHNMSSTPEFLTRNNTNAPPTMMTQGTAISPSPYSV